YHCVVPAPEGPRSVTIAVGILGATVMPHAIYLHSSLMQNRVPTTTEAERRRVLRFSNAEVLFALGVAGLINMAMVAMAAGVFHETGHSEVADIGTASRTLIPLLGAGGAVVFLLSFLASCLASSGGRRRAG